MKVIRMKTALLLSIAYITVFFTALGLITGGFVKIQPTQIHTVEGEIAPDLGLRDLLRQEGRHQDIILKDYTIKYSMAPTAEPVDKSERLRKLGDIINKVLVEGGYNLQRKEITTQQDIISTTVAYQDTSGELEPTQKIQLKAEPTKQIQTGEVTYLPFKGQRIHVPNSNPYPYKFVLSATPCRPDHDMVIVVHSAAHYHKRRTLIRSSWLDRAMLERFTGLRPKIVFFVGYSKNFMVNKHLKYEQDTYDDVVQSNFIESYYNNTYKALSYMRWVSSNCRQARLIMKIDDDSLLHPENLPNLTAIIHQGINANNTDVYMGFQVKYPDPNRNKKDKWYMSPERWPYDKFPMWFQGLAYFLTPSLAEKLVPIAVNVPYTFMDDVYVGMLVDQVRPRATVTALKDLSASSAMQLYSIDYYLHERWRQKNATFFHMPNMNRFTNWYAESLVKLIDKQEFYKTMNSLWPHYN